MAPRDLRSSFASRVAARRNRAGRPPKREALLDAATHEFALRGFFAAQVADVARRAGVAAGTVYLYFRSKDDLLCSIFERTMTEALADGRALVSTAADPVDQLHGLARLHLGRLGRDRHLAAVFQIELRQSSKFMRHLSTSQLREYLGLLRETIATGQTQGRFRAGVSPTLAAKMLFGALDEMATNWILSPRDYPLEGEADAVVDLFLHGVRGPAESAEPTS
jgi:TetR/AcrR family fatty acid metabolism transcriptional regulator